MKKSELLSYDLEAPDWLVSQIDLKDMSLVREKDEENGLMIYKFYQRKDINKGLYEPYLVIFKDKHSWLNYYPKGNRWGKASIEHIYDRKIYGFYGVLKNLRKWQDNILRKRLAGKKQLDAEKTSNMMKLVPELPGDFREFCEEDLMKDANYLVYSSKRKKVYCTHCRQEYALDDLIRRNDRKPRHREFAMCDKCLVEIQTISENMSRNNNYFRRSTEIMQQYKEGVVVREFNVYRDFEKTLAPETKIIEIKRHIFVDGKYLKYESRWFKENARRWHRIKEWRHFIEITFAEGKVYQKNVNEVLENSKYAIYNLPEYFKKQGVDMRDGFEKILKNIYEHPYVEQFIKAELYGLTESVINGRFPEQMVDRKQTELTKMLKINREQLRWLRNCRDQDDALRIMQQANIAGKHLTELEVVSYAESSRSYKERNFLLRTDINTSKACQYIKTQGISLEDFIDHVELMDKLQIVAKKQYLFPKDFRQTHQEEIEADILKNDKISGELQRDFKRTYSRWAKIARKVSMQDKTYKIVFPKDCADIKTEGRILHHCVGNYVESAAAGKTVILFMRRKDALERRLYTMEYKGGKLVQIRAACNGEPEKEAKEFANRFAENFAIAESEYVKREQKKAQKEAI